jgi:Fe2+ or Zn2+ uptake regulation protein
MKIPDARRETRQRQIILQELQSRRDHPSADMIYDAVREVLPRISLGTVYRNLELLHNMGLIEKIDAGSGQARYDGDVCCHCHTVCTVCGAIGDVPEDAILSFEYDARKVGLREITGHIVQFTGTCSKCGECSGS